MKVWLHLNFIKNKVSFRFQDDKYRTEKLTSINAVSTLNFKIDEEMFINNTNTFKDIISKLYQIYFYEKQ